MKKHILGVYGFNLAYAKRLVDDVSAEQFTAQPRVDGCAVPNHPAWVLGHLANTSGVFGATLLGVEPHQRDGWKELFGGGSKPLSDASLYPDKAALLAALEESHQHIAAAFDKAGDARLAETNPAERLRPIFPTIADMIVFIMTSHEATHLGQLSAWRRAMGLPSVFG